MHEELYPQFNARLDKLRREREERRNMQIDMKLKIIDNYRGKLHIGDLEALLKFSQAELIANLERKYMRKLQRISAIQI